jgi:hypothetical protein
MARKTAQDHFRDCPGAWLANMPHAPGETGNIVVNVKQIVNALDYLKRNRFEIHGTDMGPCEGSILVQIGWKPKA